MNAVGRIVLAAVLAAVAAGLPARQWPDEPLAVTGSFASASLGSFSQGLEFASSGGRIGPWSAGEVIWSAEPGDPLGTGTGLIVLEHSGGYRSRYLGIEGRPDLGDRVGADEWLGYASGSTWSFAVTDAKRSRIVDPVALLPSREGIPAPRWGTVELVGGGERLPMAPGLSIRPGRWSLVIDPAGFGAENAIPMEVSLYWVGEGAGSLRFDSLEERDGTVLAEVPESRAYADVYDDEGRLVFRDILFNAGRGTLELRLRDETGRVVRTAWNLSVGE